MTTLAKFTCNEVAKRQGWGANKVVYSAKFTPVSGDRDDHFEVGKTYYVDFSEEDDCL
jgi:hypothetical protein